MEGFRKHFSEFVTKRTEDIWAKAHEFNEGLKEIDEKQTQLYSKLEETLSEDAKKLLEEYKGQVDQEIGFLRHIVYSLGFKDGINKVGEKDEEIIDSLV